MRAPPRILVVDDNPDTVLFLQDCLSRDYEVLTAPDGEQGLAMALREQPDLILLDIMLPKLDGIKVCRELKKAGRSLPFMPIILLSARPTPIDIVQGLEAGADEYLIKPVERAPLVARVRSMLRLKSRHDELDERVKRQVDELERISRLRRYLPQPVVDLIVSPGGAELLQPHRRSVTVVFTDMRGYTDFADAAEPEDVIHFLKEYFGELGQLIDEYQGTLERFTGDGLMVFFNDPIECANPQERAVMMALRMRERVGKLTQAWWGKLGGHMLGFGVGIDHGYATLGQIGFESRFDYAAVGNVVIRSARLCAAARDKQILITQPVYAAVADLVEVERIGDLELKGFQRPVRVYNILQPK